MIRFVVVVALVTGCRGSHTTHDDPAAQAATEATVFVPHLPQSPDGMAELEVLDGEIALYRSEPRSVGRLIHTLLERATLLGGLEDYVEALDRTKAWVAAAPRQLDAWKARTLVLGRVHKIAEARAALETVKKLTADVTEWEDLAATLDELQGKPAIEYRERRAKQGPSAITLTQWAVSLAAAGRFDEAIDLIPRAAGELRDPSPITIAWLYFQWGRLFELKGTLATAREYYELAHVRMPASLEPVVHLAQTRIATGKPVDSIVTDAVARNPHPELLALAGQTAAAQAAWERYLAALPEAFADHAARFFLAAGKQPARALALANVNLANRDTADARALVIEAALAVDDPKAACAVVEPLITGLRSQQFVAWRALSACGRKTDADRVAQVLGIH